MTSTSSIHAKLSERQNRRNCQNETEQNATAHEPSPEKKNKVGKRPAPYAKPTKKKERKKIQSSYKQNDNRAFARPRIERPSRSEMIEISIPIRAVLFLPVTSEDHPKPEKLQAQVIQKWSQGSTTETTLPQTRPVKEQGVSVMLFAALSSVLSSKGKEGERTT